MVKIPQNSSDTYEEVRVSKRGCITLPPKVRKLLGLDKSSNARLILELKDGTVVLRSAVMLPIRDYSIDEINSWLKEDSLPNTQTGKE